MKQSTNYYLAFVGLLSLIAVLLGVANILDKKGISVGASVPISSLTELTSLSHNDVFAIVDTANTQTKKLKWGTATSSMKTVFDTVYSTLFTTSSGLASILSDESGTGKVVYSTSTVLETPRINVGPDATGDMWYRNSSGNVARLGVCGTNQAVGSAGGVPSCVSIITFPYTASSTFTATTTIEASSLAKLVLNGLSYAFPSSRGSANTVLTEDGSGNLSFTAPTSYNFGRTSTSSPGGKGTLTIAHGLGVTPRLVKFTFSVVADGGAANLESITMGSGVATSTSATQSVTAVCTVDQLAAAPAADSTADNQAGYVIITRTDTTVACDTTAWRAYVSTLDSTNIILTFDGTAVSGSTYGSLFITWEAYK